MKKHNKNIARTEEDFTLGILKGKTIFPYGYPGKKQMTMNTPAGVVPFPIEYIGVTNGKITDRGIALPGEDFVVNGDTVIEKQINMKNRYNTSLEEDFKKHRQELGNKGLEPMSYGKGGKMPQWLAEARFKAAGKEDEMNDYGYMKGGELSRLKAMKEKLYKKYQEGGDMMEQEYYNEGYDQEVEPLDVIETVKKPTVKKTKPGSSAIVNMIASEIVDKISSGETFSPKMIIKMSQGTIEGEDAMMISDLLNNAISMIESKDIDYSDMNTILEYVGKMGLANSPLIKTLFNSIGSAEETYESEEMEEMEEGEENEMEDTSELTFSEAYAQAKQQGLPEFMWQGSKYKTNLKSQPIAEEVEEEEIEMEEEELMDEELMEAKMGLALRKLERLKKLEQKALGGYANTPYMSQIPTGDEMGEYTPFSKYRDNNRNYKSQAGINDFLGKAMFMGQEGGNVPAWFENTDLDPSAQEIIRQGWDYSYDWKNPEVGGYPATYKNAMKKGGYTTPKYQKGQIIQYKQGGILKTGVVDIYDERTGQIKLK